MPSRIYCLLCELSGLGICWSLVVLRGGFSSCILIDEATHLSWPDGIWHGNHVAIEKDGEPVGQVHAL